ncbi:unnamed protein product [Symbiodinium sp. CCMP2592]|nr:unnamed protein product [Symbiodinium sp. CCMP2592]
MFEALDFVTSHSKDQRPAIFAFAETRAAPSSQASATKIALRSGFKVWWIGSTRGAFVNGRQAWLGGICVGVDLSLACLHLASWSHCQGNLLQLEVGSFNLLVGWRRPNEERDLFDAELLTWTSQATALGRTAVLMRDWNDEPSESPLQHLGVVFEAPRGGQGALVPSRWHGWRSIDWTALSRLTLTSAGSATMSFCGHCSMLHSLDALGCKDSEVGGRTRPQGSLYVIIDADPLCGRSHLGDEGVKIRKLSSFLGRLHEAVRCGGGDGAASGSLVRKIDKTWPTDIPCAPFEQAIGIVEEAVAKLRQAKVSQGGSDAIRWLKNEAGLLPPAGSGGESGGVTSHTVFLTTSTVGGAGPDGLSVQEAAHLLLRFWQWFAELLRDWQLVGIFFEALQHARMVCLPKDEISGDETSVPVKRLRPITILPFLYRIAVGTWTSRASTREWLAKVTPPALHGGIGGRTAWDAIRILDSAWTDGKVLVSFDFHLCFDHVSPALALRWTWQHQRRWIQVGQGVSASPELVESGLPQGCPASPMTLILLLVAPALRLQDELDQGLVQTLFLDDRTAVVDDAATAAIGSSRRGVIWPLAKLNVITTCPRHRRGLGISPSMEAVILGTTFTVDDQDLDGDSEDPTLQASDSQPDSAACRRLRTDCIAPASFRPSRGARLMVAWMGSAVRHAAKTTTKVKAGLNVIHTGSRPLWLLSAGHWMDVHFASRLNSLRGFWHAEEYFASAGVLLQDGRWGRAVQDFLTELGFQRYRDGAWQHGWLGGFDLTLSTRFLLF